MICKLTNRESTTIPSNLAATLTELADDLQSEIDARYGGMQDQYPGQMRRYQRDIEPVTRARALVAEWRAENGG